MTQNKSTIDKAHILVRLDANHQIGLAHAIRVSSILNMLQTPHHITVYGAGELIADYFLGQHIIPVPHEGPDIFFSSIEKIRTNLILVDHPRLGHEFWHQLRMSGCNIPLVAIDDEGGNIEADLVINGTVLEQYHHYPLLHTQANLLCGEKYALIRPAFGATPWQNPDEPSVVIVVGSGDRARDWALQLASGKVGISRWGKVKMIVGRAFPDMAELQSHCTELGISLESGLSGESMAEALSQACVALVTGGMIVYEALAVGVPLIVFPQIENLIPEAKWFAHRECIIDLGYEGGADSGLVSEAIEKLLSSPSMRRAMSAVQRETIDGRGMSRAAMEIDELLLNSFSSVAYATDQHRRSQP